ncbi:protein ENDOSPERM DEFECTIVE 1-like [Musa acuminata AAA Group]|uniref:protein ENDOSPERM DEFECTIVE 1-like n=1 Tax=Musa acuminata AAA Group TaxID=214697 RepID=UPI0031D939B9
MMVESSSLPPLPPPLASAAQPPIPTPPATDRRPRRPRAREVTSRYLSPSPSSSSSSSSCSSSEAQHFAASPRNVCPAVSLLPLLPKKPQKHHEPPEADENQPLASTRRSVETPLPVSTKPPATLKKKAVVRLFADNNAGTGAAEQPPRPGDTKRRPRPGTPMPPHLVADGTSVGRRNPRPPTPARVSPFPFEGNSYGHGSGDNRLEETLSENSFSDSETCSVSSQGGLCDSPPLLPPASCRSRPVAEVRSSMPEADLLSARRATEACSSRQTGAEDSACRASTSSFCLRSLTSAMSCRQQQHPLNLSKSVNRPLFSSKPPQPPTAKSITEVKKGKKESSRKEEVHVLKLLDNHYVQWRFINAKARAAMEARRIAAERSLHGLSATIAELQSSVTEKKIQLEQLKRRESLSSIIRCQMLHLDEWTVLEDEYSSSLSGATKALQDASLRLPINGNVKVDNRELKEVLDYALLMLESLSPCVENFLPKTADIDNVASDLASVISTQKTLVEECGNLLSEAHRLQVKECSLRTQLIQVKQHNVYSSTVLQVS